MYIYIFYSYFFQWSPDNTKPTSTEQSGRGLSPTLRTLELETDDDDISILRHIPLIKYNKILLTASLGTCIECLITHRLECHSTEDMILGWNTEKTLQFRRRLTSENNEKGKLLRPNPLGINGHESRRKTSLTKEKLFNKIFS